MNPPSRPHWGGNPQHLVHQYHSNAVHCSVGAHVRDAAAYVCWAFARAYTADVMADTCPAIAPALMTTACYDREVSLPLCSPCSSPQVPCSCTLHDDCSLL